MITVHRERIYRDKRTSWVVPFTEGLACQLNPAMTFKRFMLLGHSKMDGDRSAPFTQKVKQQERLFHAVRPDHTDAQGQETADKKQQALRL